MKENFTLQRRENLFSRRLFIKLLAGTAGGGIVLPSFSMLRVHTAYAEGNIDCPIYMFHQTGAASVKQVMTANSKRLPITIAQLAGIILGEEEVPEQPVFAMTFDDGYRIQYEQVAPALESAGTTGTFFIMGTGWRGDGTSHTYMNPGQIADLAVRGFEVGSHTINHDRNLPLLRLTNYGEYLQEIFTSKEQLEGVTQAEVVSFAYPHGAFNDLVALDVNNAYKAAVSTIPGRIQTASILDRLLRTRIS